jgi:hypothetical protein
MKFDVTVEWEQDAPDVAYLSFEIKYECPIDKFWDDDLKAALTSDAFVEDLKKSKCLLSDYGEDHAAQQFEEKLSEILEVARMAKNWKLTRDFGSSVFRWERDFYIEAEPDAWL